MDEMALMTVSLFTVSILEGTNSDTTIYPTLQQAPVETAPVIAGLRS